MGTKAEHRRLPENASHEGWRKGRRAARSGEAAAPKDHGLGARGKGLGKWRDMGRGEPDRRLGG